MLKSNHHTFDISIFALATSPPVVFICCDGSIFSINVLNIKKVKICIVNVNVKLVTSYTLAFLETIGYANGYCPCSLFLSLTWTYEAKLVKEE